MGSRVIACLICDRESGLKGVTLRRVDYPYEGYICTRCLDGNQSYILEVAGGRRLMGALAGKHLTKMIKKGQEENKGNKDDSH